MKHAIVLVSISLAIAVFGLVALSVSPSVGQGSNNADDHIRYCKSQNRIPLFNPPRCVLPLAPVDPRQQQSQTLNEQGRVAFQEGRFEDALRRFQDAESLYPSPDYRTNIEKAREAIRRRDVHTVFADGIATFDRREYERAIALFERVVSIDPNNAAAHDNIRRARIALAFQQGLAAPNPTRAIEMWDRVLALDPGNEAAKNNRELAIQQAGLVNALPNVITRLLSGAALQQARESVVDVRNVKTTDDVLRLMERDRKNCAFDSGRCTGAGRELVVATPTSTFVSFSFVSPEKENARMKQLRLEIVDARAKQEQEERALVSEFVQKPDPIERIADYQELSKKIAQKRKGIVPGIEAKEKDYERERVNHGT